MPEEPPSTCPRCGNPRPADEPLCTQCALKAALETVAGGGSGGDGPSRKVEAIGRTAARPQSASESSGDAIGPYRLVEKLGEGGFGVVWKADQSEPIRRQVALKVIKPGMDSAEIITRFEAERQALALMDHPGIANVFDAGTTETGRPFFVMELVEGRPVTEYCDAGRLDLRQRLELFREICGAVQHAHQKGVIHRDLKPNNILVTELDGEPAVKVIDFGIAKSLGQELTEETLFTAQGQLMGTPQYMSPEQAGMGAKDVDTRSDIYSLGVVLYELLTGRPPFDRERLRQAGLEEILRMIREEEPPKPSNRLSQLEKEEITTVARAHRETADKLTRHVRGDLDWIVMKAVEKDRNRRYETASAFSEDIGRYLTEKTVQATPPTAIYRMRKFARRNRGALSAAAAIAVTLIAATTVSVWQAVAARKAERAEGKQREVAEAQTIFAEGKAREAERSEERLRHQLAISNLERADSSFESDEPLRALGHISEALRLQPGNLSIVRRAFSMVERRRWFIPDRVVASTSGWNDLLRVNGEHREFQDARGRWLVVEETRPAEVTLLRVRDLVSGEPVGLPVAKPAEVGLPTVSLSPMAELLVIEDSDIWVFDVDSGSLKVHLPGEDQPGRNRKIQVSPDNRYVFAGTRTWSIHTGELVGEIPTSPRSISFDPAGEKVIITTGEDAICRTLDGWGKRFEIDELYGAQFTRNGRFVIADRSGGGIRVHSAEDGSLLYDTQAASFGTGAFPNDLFEGPRGDWWLLRDDGRVWFCRPDPRGKIQGRRSVQFPFDALDPQVSPNGRYAALYDERIQNVRIVDLEECRGWTEIRPFGQGVALAKPDDIPSLNRVFFPQDGESLIAHYDFSSYSSDEDAPTYVSWTFSPRPLDPRLISLRSDPKRNIRLTAPDSKGGVMILDRSTADGDAQDPFTQISSRVHSWRPGSDGPAKIFESPDYCWLSPDGNFLLSLESESRIKVVNTLNWSSVGTISIGSSFWKRSGREIRRSVESLDTAFRGRFAASADGATLAFVPGEGFEGPEGKGEKIRLFSGTDGSLLREFDFYFQPEPTLARAGGSDLTLIFTMGLTGPPPPAVLDMYLDSEILSVASNRGYIRWKRTDGERIVAWPLRSRSDYYDAPRHSPAIGRFLAEHSGSNLLVFVPETGKTHLNHEFDNSIESGDWSPTGRWFVTTLNPGTVQIWDSRDWSAPSQSWRFGSSLDAVDVQVAFSQDENLALFVHGDWHNKMVTISDLDQKFDVVSFSLPEPLRPNGLGFLPGETGFWIVNEDGIWIHQLFPDSLSPQPAETGMISTLIEVLAGATFAENAEMRASLFDDRVRVLEDLRNSAGKEESGLAEFVRWFLDSNRKPGNQSDHWGSFTAGPELIPVWTPRAIRTRIDRTVPVAGLVSDVLRIGESDSYELQFVGANPGQLVAWVHGVSDPGILSSWKGRWIELRGTVTIFGDQTRILFEDGQISLLKDEVLRTLVPEVRNLEEIREQEGKLVELTGTISTVSTAPRGNHLILSVEGLNQDEFQIFVHENHREEFAETPSGPLRIVGRVWESRETVRIDLQSSVQLQPR